MNTTTAVEKKTQSQMFAEIRDYIGENRGPKEFIDFLDDRIALLAKQSAAAKERKAKKEKPADELYAAVLGCLGEKLKTRDEIAAELEGEFPEVTGAKVTARLAKLVKEGKAGKLSVNVGQGKRIMAYALSEFIPNDED